MDSLVKEFFTTLLAGFIFLMVLFTNPAFGYIIETNSSSGNIFFADPIINDPNPTQLGGGTGTSTPSSGTGTSTSPSTETSTGTTNLGTGATDSSGIQVASSDPTAIPATNASQTCAVSKLSPLEAKGIMDLTSQGFAGEKITEGDLADANKKNDVKEITDASLVGKELGGDRAVKVDAPKYAAPADRFSFFNNQSINGPFGIGLIIDDTLRVGRCADLPEEQCRVFGSGLNMRTGGTGIKTDLVNAFDSVSSDATKDAGTIASQNLSKEEYDKMKANYLDFNTGDKDFTTGSFTTDGPKITNSIYTQNYIAKNATSCNNSACTISTYSAFDKYFNAWLSTDMVVFNIGPTVLNKANKLLSKAYRLSTSSYGGKPLANPLGIFESFKNKTIDTLTPKSLVGYRYDRYNALLKEEGFDSIMEPFTIKAKLFSSGGGGENGKLVGPDSPIWKFTPEKKRKFFEAIENLRGYARGNAEYVAAAKAEFAASAKTAADKLTYAEKVTNYLVEWDDAIQLDTPAWMKINDDLFSLNGLALRKNGPYPDGQGYVDISTAAPFNFKRALQQFGKDGDWRAWSNSQNADTFTALANGDLQLYKIDVKEVLANNATLNDLKGHIVKYGQGGVSVKLADGRVMSLTNESFDYIAGLPGAAGNLTVYKSGYVPTNPLTPADFANRVTDSRMVGRPETALRNLDEIHNGLVQNDYAGRKSYSFLDQQFANEGDMLKAYYKNPAVGGVYKGLVLPIVYWEAKKGLGNADYSAYMLPETWTTLSVNQGVDTLYKDSYIDFYANEGSDQGDMFKRAFNSLPFVWNKIVTMGASTNQFTSDMLNKVTFGFLNDDGMVQGGMRDTVGDVAFYSHNENCVDCTGSLVFKDNYFGINFIAATGMQAYLLEAANDETKKVSGTTLISYSHHSNLEGKAGQNDGDSINLVSAQREGNTCDQQLKKLGLGFFGTASGGVLGVAENAAYFVGFGYGLIASLIQQMYYARELQDCVDDKEGYYIHFYAPPAKEAASTKSKEILSNETVSSALSDMSSKLDAVVKEKTSAGTEKTDSQKNPVEQSMDKIKDQFSEFADKAKSTNILQASIEMLPTSTGGVKGTDVFYVWFKDSAMPIGYRTTGKVTTTDGNISVEEDYTKGTLSINGKQVLGPDKADHVRMIAQDNRIPAKVVPVTLNKVAAPNDNSIVFQLNTYGELKVLNTQVLDCIQKAVVDQTGITYTGDELTQVFGDLKAISTELYSAVVVNKTAGEIVLEGSGARYKGTGSAKFVVDGFWDTRLEIDANQTATGGKFVGMNFENGSIVLKPSTNELIIWLRQHAQSILSSKDVKGLNAKLTTVKDPESECDEPAIDLEAVPQSGDELGAKRVDNFNTSMDHLGPFTQFTTDKRIYEFYAKRDETTGECKNYFRVRDKDTGKILTDSEIVGGITQSPDGTISFTTADGQNHTLKFDAENGVPKVSYNGGAPETLLSAQGPNGSFWYDPNKGLWYPENGLQIPLNQAFKDNGAYFGTDANGNVTGTPTNPMTFNLGQQGSTGFNIPSMPQTASGIILFTSAFLLVAFFLTRRKQVIAKVR